eukprot:5376717-Amphidinium_carterae.1
MISISYLLTNARLMLRAYKGAVLALAPVHTENSMQIVDIVGRFRLEHRQQVGSVMIHVELMSICSYVQPIQVRINIIVK